MLKISVCDMSLKITDLSLQLHHPVVNELNQINTTNQMYM